VKRLPFRVRIIRDEATGPGGRRGQALRRLAITGLAALGLSQVIPLPAAFGQAYYYGGTLTATISLFQPVKSIVLDASALVFNNCQTAPNSGPVAAGLVRAGNGACLTTPVTVTIGGNVGSSVLVQGAVATPDAGGGSWALCGASSEACGNASFPGSEQYQLSSYDAIAFPGIALPHTQPTSTTTLSSTVTVSDLLFGAGGGPNPPGTNRSEPFWLIGPNTTANTTATFYTTSVNWTAL
jgi:hypothetical protein